VISEQVQLGPHVSSIPVELEVDWSPTHDFGSTYLCSRDHTSCLSSGQFGLLKQDTCIGTRESFRLCSPNMPCLQRLTYKIAVLSVDLFAELPHRLIPNYNETGCASPRHRLCFSCTFNRVQEADCCKWPSYSTDIQEIHQPNVRMLS
jgi:hypothetical protein